MRFTKFEFSHFKGIGHVSIDLSGGSSPAHALVGLNESGKTTVLEAISAFGYGVDELGVLEMPGTRFEGDPNLWVPIADRSNFNDKVTIGALLSIDAEDQEAVRAALLAEHEMDLISISDDVFVREKYAFQNSRHTKKNSTWTLSVEGKKRGRGFRQARLSAPSPEWSTVVRVLRDRFPVIWHFPNFLFDIPEWLYLEDSPTASSAENSKHQFYRETISDVLRKIDSTMNISEHIVQRMKSADETDARSLESLQLKVASELTSTIFGTWN